MEALNLKWEDIDLKKKQVTFKETKSGKSRTIPLNNILVDMLKRINKNGENIFTYGPDHVSHELKKYLKLVGFNQRRSVHTFRHTFASHMVVSGLDIYILSKILGHSSVTIISV